MTETCALRLFVFLLLFLSCASVVHAAEDQKLLVRGVFMGVDTSKVPVDGSPEFLFESSQPSEQVITLNGRNAYGLKKLSAEERQECLKFSSMDSVFTGDKMKIGDLVEVYEIRPRLACKAWYQVKVIEVLDNPDNN